MGAKTVAVAESLRDGWCAHVPWTVAHTNADKKVSLRAIALQ